MGHRIIAIIGRPRTLAPLIARFGPPAPVELPFGLILAPLDEERLDALAVSSAPAFEGFTYLTPAMAAEIGRALGSGSALYLETDYHGGAGFQSAALFEAGTLLWRRAEAALGPRQGQSWLSRFCKPSEPRAPSPISAGLAHLGVRASGGRDEFDRVGLAEFRSLEALGLDPSRRLRPDQDQDPREG